MATIKHIASKTANYGNAELYLTFQHDEFSMKPVLDDTGHYVPRESYLYETILCGDDDFAIACMKSNLEYRKNNHNCIIYCLFKAGKRLLLNIAFS